MTLYIVGTPIGNLEDMTFRAVRILNACDLILCEDTRTSRVLLNHYNIKKDLVSYHKFNEKRQEEFIVQQLEKGKTVGLISDAGMPCIADPGQKIVATCREHNFKVEVIPGPSSLLTALSGSGWDVSSFQFVGFIPKKSGQTKRLLEQIVHYEGVTIAFETKHRLLKTLQILTEFPLEICLTKELTKVFESYFFGSASEIIQQLQNKSLKGEFVVLFRGTSSV
jgi:16S rRNA (cytidine1402-2'-O)-methyltransferase